MNDMWVIYQDPDDFPGEVIARRFVLDVTGFHPTPVIIRAKFDIPPAAEIKTPELHKMQLEAVRRMIKLAVPSAQQFERVEGDDPTIVETWF